MTGTDPVVPKVDDQFWFTYSESVVTSAQQNRDQAAAKLQTLVTWLWGIYTTTAAVGFTLAAKELPGPTKVFITLASAALIGVYWAAVWVQLPIDVEFDPRSPTEIQEAYATSVKEKGRRLHIALFLSVIAAGLVFLSILIVSTADSATSAAPSLAADVYSSTAGKRALLLTAQVGHKVEKALLCIRPITPLGNQDAPSTNSQSSCSSYKPTADGLIQLNVPLVLDTTDFEFSLSFAAGDGTQMVLSRKITSKASDVARGQMQEGRSDK